MMYELPLLVAKRLHQLGFVRYDDYIDAAELIYKGIRKHADQSLL